MRGEKGVTLSFSLNTHEHFFSKNCQKMALSVRKLSIITRVYKFHRITSSSLHKQLDFLSSKLFFQSKFIKIEFLNLRKLL